MKYLNKETNGITLSRIGLGAMRMADIQQGIDTIHAALDSGITYLNTGDFYGHGESELIIREALKTRKREDVFISVKFGGMLTPDDRFYGIDVRPQSVQNYLAYTLKRLGTDYVDLYQPARINPHIPVEETIGAVSDMVKAGYVRNVGITEIDAGTLRRAHAVHPISLVEVRYSLLDREIEQSLIPTARELGIGIVTFANLFHGVIGGSNPEEKLATLSRRMPPQAAEKLKQAVARLDVLKEMAAEKNVSVSQLAIAWVLAQGGDMLALVGSRTVGQLRDTVKAIEIDLSKEDLQRIEQAIPKEYASNSAMLPIDLDENGLFKF
ncbi:aldo/keto reductase [Parabacteroides faecis]|uniref:Aryl-alcohol dehydrogenase-like predicted oxidoreductase n=1 Tax=Parabacteroides faecis TaxID=1217282 RepID=A0ABR6KMF6_9BACT|nr:aldo/keto reductase [Parabacteroides faecis]MBB4622682.1 aryl-alcohol dehydrogenase-like predicted oxidoreductase [Parabacteroides faecis]GGK08769.1 oxidoreductase [Parabacteroides faecis]